MEWVVIKGISDYADGTKSASQQWRSFASVMAASVVSNLLKEASVLRDWPHYKGINSIKGSRGICSKVRHLKQFQTLPEMYQSQTRKHVFFLPFKLRDMKVIENN